MNRIYSFILSVVCVCASAAQTTFVYQDQQLTTDEHTWLVDDSGVSGAHVFASLREALLVADSLQRRAPQGTYTEDTPLAIYIAPSVYWIDDPDDPAVRRPLPGEGIPYGLKVRVSHLRLIGLTDSPEHVIVASNRGQTQGAMGNFTMLHFTGEDIELENLTLGNYCNVDLDYPLNPALNRKRRADAIVQAQLAICEGDRVAARNCRFISRLNSCPLVGARRTFFEDCYFECTDDALCGTGVYHRCRFTLFSGKPFYSTQGTGAVFLNCDLHARTSGRQYLVKAGSPVTMVDCRWTCEHPNLQICWTQDPTDDQRSYQYGLTQDGRPLLVDSGRSHLTVDMAGKPVLEAFRVEYPDTVVYNLRNLLGGADGWNPARQTIELPQAPVALRLTHRYARIESGVDTLHLRACKLGFMQKPDFKDMPTDISWRVISGEAGSVALHRQTDGSLVVKGCSENDEPCRVCILATDPSGLEAACVVTVYPRQLPSPAFTASPRLVRRGDSLVVDYQLALEGRADHSEITWWRSPSSLQSEAIPVAVSRNHIPLRSYRLTAADKGCYVWASVSPKHLRSPLGQPQYARTRRAVRIKAQHMDSLHTDFLHFPSMRQPRIIPGHWTVDACKPADTDAFNWVADTLRSPWLYGRGVDGAARSWGLMQGVRGARLRYTPLTRPYGDMELTLRVDPCKSAGQGFGSATGQYMDVCIKMDTRTLTGYALRIERTVKHDKAVDFCLMRYTDGVAVPITEPVSSICYRTGCVIRLSACGGKLVAHVSNARPLPAIHREGLVSEVHLEAPIEMSSHGGISIQHTGSTGASATLLRELSVVWE